MRALFGVDTGFGLVHMVRGTVGHVADVREGKQLLHGQETVGFGEAYKPVFGEDHRCVGKDSGETAHVERWNNTLRQRLGRLVRKTLSFSKTEENHEASLKLFIHEYNIAAHHEYLSG